MFLPAKRPKNPNYYDPVLKRKMKKLSDMYPRNQIWRHMHKSVEQVNQEYKRRLDAVKKIKNFMKFMKRMNQARQLNVKNRTPNNPLWANFVKFQMRMPSSHYHK